MSEHHHHPHDHDHPHGHEHGQPEHNHLYGPSTTGSVVLDMGGDIGVLILDGPRELLGREIEISPIDADPTAHRTHSMVRERITGAGTTYAALYVSVPAGTYTVWADHDTPAGTVTVQGGEIANFTWPA